MLGSGCGGRGLGGSFGRRRKGAVEDVEDGGRHGLVGIGEEDAYLPHLGFVKLGFESGHAGEADAVFYLPVGFANRIVADADDVGVVPVRFEQWGSVGIHVAADGGGLVVEAVAEGAALSVNAGTGGECGLIGLHVGADHLFLNARVERDMDELGFMREGRIGDRNGHIAVCEVRQESERNKDDAEDKPNEESHM